MERTAKGKTRRPAAGIQFSPSFYGRISISSISFSFLHSTVSAAAANANNLKPSAHPQYLAYHTELQIRRRIFSSSSGKKSSWIKRITKETENMVSWAGLHKNYGVYGVDHLTPII
jgi:hypothetical protein